MHPLASKHTEPESWPMPERDHTEDALEHGDSSAGDLGRSEKTLLAIDLGLRCGLALYGEDGRLRWYRSSHFANRAQLKKAIYGILRPIDGLAMIVMEGDRELAAFWRKLADKWEIPTSTIGAEVWRRELLLQREQQSGQIAKETADEMARAIIAWSDLPAPTSLRHDAAEAILIGLHGVREQGWLEDLPSEIAR